MTLWSHDLVRTRDKLKLLYPYGDSAYGHRIWYDGNITWWTSNHKVISHFDHVVAQGHVKKQKPLYLHYKSAYDYQTWQNDSLPWWAPTYKVTSPFDRVVSARSRDKLKPFYLHYYCAFAFDHQIWYGGDLT